MSPLVVVLLLIAGLSESAGRILPWWLAVPACRGPMRSGCC